MDASERDKTDQKITGQEITDQNKTERKITDQQAGKPYSFDTAIVQDTIATLPGGVALYKIGDRVETLYFSKGVPELSGYTQEIGRASCRGRV